MKVNNESPESVVGVRCDEVEREVATGRQLHEECARVQKSSRTPVFANLTWPCCIRLQTSDET
jgi:hypothetical protein